MIYCCPSMLPLRLRLSCMLWAGFLFVLCVPPRIAAQQSRIPKTAPETGSFERPPEHPITDAQMHEFFEVCHIPTASRKLTHEKMEVQRNQLPAWYPPAVWDEIEMAIDNVDLPEIALPIYREHISEQLADDLIKFLSTKPGQDVVRVVIEKMIQAQHAGATVADSHQQALEYLWEDKNGAQTSILGEMTTEQRRKAESLGAEYLRMQPILAKSINAILKP